MKPDDAFLGRGGAQVLPVRGTRKGRAFFDRLGVEIPF